MCVWWVGLGSHIQLLKSTICTDGFSPFPSIMTYFKDLSAEGLPPHWDMAQSLLSSCPTVLLDADTGINSV